MFRKAHMGEETVMSGGCQCGRVRYAVRVADDDAYLCHCRMCQRASGNVSLAFRNVNKADVTWEREPDHYASSPIALRGFCSACGTPLTFEYPDSDKIDLSIGSFDDPSRFIPREHFGIESRLPHWRDTEGLPGYRTEENAPIVARWKNIGGKLPD